MATDDAAFSDHLDRFLDALADGADHAPNGLPVLEPQFAETIHRLRTHDDAPRADPRFADRLLEDLMDTTRSLDPMAFAFDPALAPGREGRSLSRSLPRLLTPRARWMPAHLATAALIVLTLVGSLIVLGPGRSWRQSSAPAFLPAMDATPAPTAEGEISSETLIDETVDALPAGHAQVTIYSTQLQPGVSTDATGQTGTALLKVEQGNVVMTGPNGEQAVSDADTVQFPLSSSGTYGVRNVGDTEARFIEVDLLDAEETVTSTTDAGVFSDPTGGILDVPLGVGVTLPDGPGRVVLERMTLPPGTSLPAYTASGLDWIGIEAGRVGVTLEGERLPFRWDSGEERSFAKGQAIPAAAPGVRVTLRNDEDGPLVLYRLTLDTNVAAGASGTPAPS